jgi:hypothetical protein
VNTQSVNGWQNQHQAQRTARAMGTATELYGAVANPSCHSTVLIIVVALGMIQTAARAKSYGEEQFTEYNPIG